MRTISSVGVALGYYLALHQSLESSLLQCHHRLELRMPEARLRRLLQVGECLLTFARMNGEASYRCILP
jgi:hypothetical protein